MAKTKGKRSKVEKPLKEGQAQLTIAPDYSHAFPTFYSNYIQVSHTGSEAFLEVACWLSLTTLNWMRKGSQLQLWLE